MTEYDYEQSGRQLPKTHRTPPADYNVFDIELIPSCSGHMSSAALATLHGLRRCQVQATTQ